MTIKNEQILYMYMIVLVVVMVEITPPSIVFHSSLTHTSHASNFRLSEFLRGRQNLYYGSMQWCNFFEYHNHILLFYGRKSLASHDL